MNRLRELYKKGLKICRGYLNWRLRCIDNSIDREWKYFDKNPVEEVEEDIIDLDMKKRYIKKSIKTIELKLQNAD